jgi:hypothetical protein
VVLIGVGVANLFWGFELLSYAVAGIAVVLVGVRVFSDARARRRKRG